MNTQQISERQHAALIEPHEFVSGGRVSTPKFRESLQDIYEPVGLSASFERYELLTLVKRVGKGFGFSPSMIRLLDHYMSFTRECDWRAGERPIVFQSLSNTAMDLGLNERQIQNLEKALFELGAITWNDSGNHRRYGARDEDTGEIVFAFGVDLSPLAALRPAIVQRLAEMEQERDAWHTAKRRVSFYRRQLRAMLAEAQQRRLLSGRITDWVDAYELIAGQRIRVSTDIARLEAMLESHKLLFDEVYSSLKGHGIVALFNDLSPIISSTDAKNCIPYKNTIQLQTDKSVPGNPRTDNCLQGGVPQPPVTKICNQPVTTDDDFDLTVAAGMDHLQIRHLVSAASERFLLHLSRQRPSDTWNAVTDAADALRHQLGIHNTAWIEACSVLGRGGAAVCVLLTDHATQRDTNRVHSPGGYFRAMIKKARVGELRLHSSIFGILKAKGETKQ